MSNTATSGTGAGLLTFLGWAGAKGEMAPATAAARASAVRQVLAKEADDLATIDVQDMDVDAVLDRFETLNRTRFSSGSMETYRSRFRQAVALYRAWLARDPDWKNAGRAPSPRPRSASRPARAKRAVAAAEAPSGNSAPEPTSANGLVVYDLPLRPDLLVRLNLPVDMTAKDAERIAAFVRSLAFDTGPTGSPKSP